LEPGGVVTAVGGTVSAAAAPYIDRVEAGRRLASDLEKYREKAVTVLALPRGGVPLASVIADRLRAPLDVLVVRKVGAPGNREFGLGAVAEGGVEFLDRRLLDAVGVSRDDLISEIRAEAEEVERLAFRLRGGRAPSTVRDRTVVLVDDGMATGGTVRAAIEAVRRQRPARIVVAVGVSSREAVHELRPLVDEIVCPLVPPALFAVGEWYREFGPVSETEVVELLQRHWSLPTPAR
jgi:putative phosphoribosyl transferase